MSFTVEDLMRQITKENFGKLTPKERPEALGALSPKERSEIRQYLDRLSERRPALARKAPRKK